jgi:prepilin-type N-terminal cleavage/methylation domain-containing protein
MRNKRGAAGFTLIEVLIAMVVMAVALTGMIPVLVHATRGNSFGGNTTGAATRSQDKIEELKRAPFDHAHLVAGTYTETDQGYTRTWVVTAAGGQYSADIRGIEVTTQWTDAQGSHEAKAFTVRSNIR